MHQRGSKRGLSIEHGHQSAPIGHESTSSGRLGDGTGTVHVLVELDPACRTTTVPGDGSSTGSVTPSGIACRALVARDQTRSPCSSSALSSATPFVSGGTPPVTTTGFGSPDKPRLRCALCGLQFSSIAWLQFHQTRHRGVRFECLKCGSRFRLDSELETHQQSTQHHGQGIVEDVGCEPAVDSSVRRYMCDECPASYSTPYLLRCHVTRKHLVGQQLQATAGTSSGAAGTNPGGTRPEAAVTSSETAVTSPGAAVTCHVAAVASPGPAGTSSRAADSSSNLQRGGDKQYECSECDAVYSNSSSLRYHCISIHTAVVRLCVCDICGKRFQHKHLLKRHAAVHTNIRKYVCGECGAAFKNSSTLRNHSNLHTRARRYSCTLCDKQFLHLSSLTRHHLSHTGERPIQCGVCDKRFKQSGSLQQHMTTHAADQPRTCHVCSAIFTTKYQFQVHLRGHRDAV